MALCRPFKEDHLALPFPASLLQTQQQTHKSASLWAGVPLRLTGHCNPIDWLQSAMLLECQKKVS